MNYLATYTTIFMEDRDACVADTTSKANNGYYMYTSYPSPAERVLLRESSVCGKRLTAAVSILLISLVCVAMVDEALSCLVALQAKQKPRVLHRNKRYLVPHKNRHNTCVFSLRCSSLAINTFVSSATLRSEILQHWVTQPLQAFPYYTG